MAKLYSLLIKPLWYTPLKCCFLLRSSSQEPLKDISGTWQYKLVFQICLQRYYCTLSTATSICQEKAHTYTSTISSPLYYSLSVEPLFHCSNRLSSARRSSSAFFLQLLLLIALIPYDVLSQSALPQLLIFFTSINYGFRMTNQIKCHDIHYISGSHARFS